MRSVVCCVGVKTGGFNCSRIGRSGDRRAFVGHRLATRRNHKQRKQSKKRRNGKTQTTQRPSSPPAEPGPSRSLKLHFPRFIEGIFIQIQAYLNLYYSNKTSLILFQETDKPSVDTVHSGGPCTEAQQPLVVLCSAEESHTP